MLQRAAKHSLKMLIASTSLVASSNMAQRQPLRHKCLRPCKVQSFLIVSELLQALRLPKKLFSDVMISVILRCRDLGTAQTNCWSPLMFRAVDSRILKGGVKPTSTPSLRQLNSLRRMLRVHQEGYTTSSVAQTMAD